MPGRVKTRLGADIGMAAAAELAAASLLDTLAACDRGRRARRCHLSLSGDLAAPPRRRAPGGPDRAGRSPARGRRLRRAAGRRPRATCPAPVVQVGMDTPHVTPAAARRSPPGWTTTTRCSARPRTAAGGCSRCATRPRPGAARRADVHADDVRRHPGRARRRRASTSGRPPRCATSTPWPTPTRWPRRRRDRGSPRPGDRWPRERRRAAADEPGVVHPGLHRGAAGRPCTVVEARRRTGSCRSTSGAGRPTRRTSSCSRTARATPSTSAAARAG